MKFRFERTQYGWSCYAKQGAAYQYFGHFLTQREAKKRFAFEGCCLKLLATPISAQDVARLSWIFQGRN